MKSLSIIKKTAIDIVVQRKTFSPPILTASLKVSKNPVAKRAPAAKATREKEIFLISFLFKRRTATRKRDKIEAKNVNNKIFPKTCIISAS